MWYLFHWNICLSHPFLCRTLLFLLSSHACIFSELWALSIMFFNILLVSAFDSLKISLGILSGPKLFSSLAFLWLYRIPYFLFHCHFLLLGYDVWVLFVQLLLFPWSKLCIPRWFLWLGTGVAFWYCHRSQIVPISSAHVGYKVLEFGFPSRSEIVPVCCSHSRLPLFLLLFSCFYCPAPFLV